MATLKGIGYNTTTAKTTTGATGDTVDFGVRVNANLGLNVTGNADINGDLTVQGDIQSRSQSSLLIQDNFIDLNQAQNSTTSLPGGYTLQLARAASFATEINITSFTAPVAYSSGTAGGSIKFNNMPQDGTKVTLTSLSIVGNTPQEITFVDGDTTETTFGQSTGNTLKIGIGSGQSDTIAKIVAAIKVGFDASLTSQKGLSLFNLSTLSDDGSVGFNNKITFVSALGNLANQNITIAETGTTNTSRVTGNSDGAPAKYTRDAGSAVTTGDIIVVHTSADPTNDGLYGISTVSGNDHFIVPLTGINDSVRFLKNTFAASTESSGNCKAFVPDLYVQIVASGDAAIKDPSGGTIAEGVLADKFDAVADFSGFASYTVVGGDTTLQSAYDAPSGNSITTSGGTDIDLVLTNGDFDVNTTANGDVDISGAGTITLSSTNATDAAVSITSQGGLSLDLNAAGTGTAKYAILSLLNNSGGQIDDGEIVKLVAPVKAADQVQVTNAANLVTGGSATTIIIQHATGDQTFTCVAGTPGANQFQKITSGTATEQNEGTAASIASAINANSNFNAVVNGGNAAIVDITQSQGGTALNGKTITINTTTAISGNGSTFAGGVDASIAPAQADSAANAVVLGIVDANVTNGANGVVYGEGSVIQSSNYTFSTDNVGSVVYLSDSSAGGVSVTPPSGTNDQVVECGLVLAIDKIIFRPRFVMEIG